MAFSIAQVRSGHAADHLIRHASCLALPLTGEEKILMLLEANSQVTHVRKGIEVLTP